MKHLMKCFFLLLILTISITAFALTETEAAQNFAVALKQGEDPVVLIEKFKKIPSQSPLKEWANNLAVDELGAQWLALVKSPSKNK